MLKINKTIKLVSLLICVSGFSSVFALEITVPNNLQNKVAVSIIDAKTGSPIFEYRANDSMLLASNMKVVTSYVALNSLGANFRWSTTLSYNGAIKSGVLNGNLYLIGGGDPTLTTQSVTNLLKKIKALKITTINGNLILDSSIFNSGVQTSELQPEPLAEYSIDPAGLIIDNNLSAVKILIKNNKITLQGKRIANYRLQNNLQLSKQNSGCSSPASFITLSQVSNQVVQLNGSIPLNCNQKILKINLLPSFNYDQQVVKQALQQQHIKLTGTIVNGKSTGSNTLISQVKSAPLSNILITMNKDSNNLYAKTLFLSLGAYKTSNTNTYNDSKSYYQSFLKNKFNFSELVLENGAGLSRNESLSTNHMTELLYSVYQSPNAKLFMASLPTPEEAGTLQNEYPQFKGQLFAKTGSLNDVKAYSGYFISKNHQTYVISIIANGINASNPQESQLIEFKKFFADTLSKLN